MKRFIFHMAFKNRDLEFSMVDLEVKRNDKEEIFYCEQWPCDRKYGIPQSKVFQPQHYWRLGADNFLLSGATPCFVECLAALPGSAHYIPVIHALVLWQSKLFPDCGRCSWGAKWLLKPLRTTALKQQRALEEGCWSPCILVTPKCLLKIKKEGKDEKKGKKEDEKIEYFFLKTLSLS